LEQVEQYRKEREMAEASSIKMKAGISQYQAQIADLNSRLSQKEFERTLQSDVIICSIPYRL
jgi:hypothetical protein